MQTIPILFLYCWAAVAYGSRISVALEADRPSLRVQLSHTATLECCYNTMGGEVMPSWKACFSMVNYTVAQKEVVHTDHRVTVETRKTSSGWCHILTLKEARLNDTGLYQCFLQHQDLQPSVYSHGTFLQVYKPMPKTLNISESMKNSILTAEGVLLILCVVLPGSMLLCKAQKLKSLEKRKVKEEEENIYEGLNLEDCTSTYDQIQRSQVQGPYQDVGNVIEEDIQLEKP